jgi:hypothetical protein
MADETAVQRYEQEDMLPVSVIKKQFAHLHELMADVLKKDEDYGTIPGTNKPTLYKPGAEKICTMFRLDPQFEVLRNVLDDDFILYDVKCDMFSITTGRRLGSGLGSCNSREEKYNWKKAHSDAEYEATAPDRRRLKVFVKKDGTTYNQKQIRTNPYDTMNTIEKMACKRAMVAAVLITTNASAIFTQDLEDQAGVTTAAGEPTGAAAAEAAGGEKSAESSDVKKVTEGMVKLMHVLFGKMNPPIKDENVKHEYAAGFLKHEVKHLADLPMNEGRQFIDHLQEKAKGAAA